VKKNRKWPPRDEEKTGRLFAPFIFQGKQDDTAFLGEGCRLRFYWRWPLTRAPVVIWVQLA
jgi:hypothetical protein